VWSGFLLICLAQFDDGWKLLKDAMVTNGQKNNPRKVLEALETLYSFDAWSSMDKFWKLSKQTDYATDAKKSLLAQMLTMVCDYLPRQHGNRWKLPIVHNTMHTVSDMCKYGKPKEANRSEVGEKNHKVFGKHIG
jgi:hypothetical protein